MTHLASERRTRKLVCKQVPPAANTPAPPRVPLDRTSLTCPPPICKLQSQREDLAAIVARYLSGVVAGAPVEAIVDFYLAAKAEAVSQARGRGTLWWVLGAD